jgi:glucose/galactose transporter
MVLLCLLFFIFGFVTWLNGPLITFVTLAFHVSTKIAFLVPGAFYLSYFFLSVPAALIMKKTGMKKGMGLGLLVMAVGAVGFGQFVSMRIFPGALTSLFIIGAGLAILQTASNPYASIVGPIDSAAQRIAIMGICNKLAGVLAAPVFNFLVMSGVDKFAAKVDAITDPALREQLLSTFAHKVYLPYMAMAALLAILALYMMRSPLPEVGDAANESPEGPTEGLGAYVRMFFGFLAIFFYVGAEVMAGDAVGTYGRGFGLPIEQTAFFTSYTLLAMAAGYVVGLILVPRFVSQSRYLAFSAILGIVLSIGAYFTKGYPSVALVWALGFANSMMWPAIFPLGIKGLGRHTEIGSALLVMGIVGGAVLSNLFAQLKDAYGFQLVFMALMVPAYTYILLFGLVAGRQGKVRAEA